MLRKLIGSPLLVAIVCMLALQANCQGWKHVCSGGKDPLFMTEKNYMAAFAASGCSPVVILSGILATRLKIQIDDCQAFR